MANCSFWGLGTTQLVFFIDSGLGVKTLDWSLGLSCFKVTVSPKNQSKRKYYINMANCHKKYMSPMRAMIEKNGCWSSESKCELKSCKKWEKCQKVGKFTQI